MIFGPGSTHSPPGPSPSMCNWDYVLRRSGTGTHEILSERNTGAAPKSPTGEGGLSRRSTSTRSSGSLRALSRSIPFALNCWASNASTIFAVVGAPGTRVVSSTRSGYRSEPTEYGIAGSNPSCSPASTPTRAPFLSKIPEPLMPCSERRAIEKQGKRYRPSFIPAG